MPRYRFILPVRAIGGYRLPDTKLHAGGVVLAPASDPAYTARIENLVADNAELAYAQALQRAEELFGYLALLGDDAAFILDGREGVRGRNVDLEESPVPNDQVPPHFESVGGVITEAGQEYVAALLDPTGEKRRTGAIVVHNAKPIVTPGNDRLQMLCDFFASHNDFPVRIQTALGILHDAACSREPANRFAQTFTALEVLTAHIPHLTVLESFFTEARKRGQVQKLRFKTKKELLDGLRKYLGNASIPSDQVNRIADYAAMSRSVSQVDIFFDYLVGLGIDVTREALLEIRQIRGSLIHAAKADETQVVAMQNFCGIVRSALIEELKIHRAKK